MTHPPDPAQPFVQARARLTAQVQEVLAGRYRIIRELGHGGMAVAYLAENLDFQRMVAIKVFRPDKGYEPGAVERFRTEAVAVAQLQHPHIIGIHARGEKGEILWFEMDFIDGGSLEERIKQGPLAPSMVARFVSHAADALAYANERGIIHRDIKPSNLLIGSAGENLIITDFGIAKIVGNTTLTESGMAVGTLAYMSPEQLAADKCPTSAADQYSLGVVAYQCLIGALPFEGTTPGQFIAAQINRPVPSIFDQRPDCPPDLARLISRMMAPNPSARWQDLNVVRRAAAEIALNGEAPSLSTAAPPARTRRKRTPLVRAATLIAPLLIAGVAFGTWSMIHSQAPASGSPNPIVPGAPINHPSVPTTTGTDSRQRLHDSVPTASRAEKERTTAPPVKHSPGTSVRLGPNTSVSPDTSQHLPAASAIPPPAPPPPPPPPAVTPTTAILSITSKLPGTFVYVNGSDQVYTVPIDKFVEVTVTPGKVHLKITSNQPGCTAREDDVVIAPGEHKRIQRNANCPNS